MKIVVDEGTPFELPSDDRRHVQQLLRGAVEYAAEGIVIWSHAGHVRLPSGNILVIRSVKASAASLLAWSAYVDPSLDSLKNLRVLPELSDEGDIGAGLSRLFCTELLAAAGSHGLLRRYRRVHVKTSTIRGAIDFNRLARTGGDLSRTPCIVWERLPRTPLNQMLRAAIDAVARDSSMRPAAGPALLALRAAFDDVRPAADPDLLAGRRPLDRDELPFEHCCALARLILRGSGIGEASSARGLGFLVRLDALFERAVVKALNDGGLAGVAKAPASYARIGPTGAIVAGSIGVGSMELDYFVPGDALGALVVDAKYKRRVAAENLQQMLAYCHIVGARRAALVFPAGHVNDRRAYFFRRAGAPLDEGVRVDILELETKASSLADWRSNARALVASLASLPKGGAAAAIT